MLVHSCGPLYGQCPDGAELVPAEEGAEAGAGAGAEAMAEAVSSPFAQAVQKPLSGEATGQFHLALYELSEYWPGQVAHPEARPGSPRAPQLSLSATPRFSPLAW